MLQRAERLGRRRAGGCGKSCRDQRVENLEIAGERQVDLVDFAIHLDFGALAETLVLDALQPQEIAVPANRQHVQAGGMRRTNRRLGPRIVGEDDGRRALWQQRVEQAQLGAVILLDRRMIIHVVAAEIGEAAGGKPHAVEPALVEAVARRFHRGVGDAGIGQFRQQPVQFDRIGRGQLAVVVAARRNHAGRADACGCMPGLLPDLAGKGGDGGFSAGAGNGDHGFGLAREKPRRDLCQREPRIVDRQHRRGLRSERRASCRDDRGGASPCGVGGIGRAVGLGAGDGDEDRARHDLARIRRHSGDLGVGGNAAIGRKNTGKVFQFHLDPVVTIIGAHPGRAFQNQR